MHEQPNARLLLIEQKMAGPAAFGQVSSQIEMKLWHHSKRRNQVAAPPLVSLICMDHVDSCVALLAFYLMSMCTELQILYPI